MSSARSEPGPALFSQAPRSDGFTLWRQAAPPPDGASSLRVHVFAPPFHDGGGQELQRPDFPVASATFHIGGLYPTGVFRCRACWVYSDNSESALGPATDADTLPAGCGPEKSKMAHKSGCVVQ